MRYQLLGQSGLRVSELCLGTMTFGEVWELDEPWNVGAAKSQCLRIFEHFAQAGGTFIDTAANYTNGESEIILGEFLARDRDRFVLTTKYSGMDLHSDDLNAGGNSRKSMFRSLEGSLSRLGTDYVDVLYLHAWDYTTPIEEVLQAANDLLSQGKILYFAFSDTPAWVVAEACVLAESFGWAPPVAVQAPYSLAQRDVERNTLPMARRWGLTVCTWGVLSGGVLSGKYSHPSDGKPRRFGSETPEDDRQRVVAAVEAISSEVGQPPSQVALNWARQCSVADIIPIVGARTIDQLLDNLGCLSWTLSTEQVDRLNQSTGFVRGYPEDLLEEVKPHLFGTHLDRFNDRRFGSL